MPGFQLRSSRIMLGPSPSAKGGSGGIDQRSAKRFECCLTATACANHVNFVCTVIDISMGGAALSGKGFCRLQSNDRVNVMVHSLDALSGTVRWVGQTGFGIQFNDATRDSPQLKMLIAKLSAMSG